MTLFWIWALLLAGLVFLLMEVFLPSHGLLGVSGLAALCVSIIFAFKMSTPLGITIFVIAMVLLPLEIVFGVKVFPSTPLGKRMMLPAREKTTLEDRSGEPDLSAYVGRDGVTVTMCRPAGIADIGGKRIDVVAEGMMIDANRPVKVLRVDGNRVVVKEA